MENVSLMDIYKIVVNLQDNMVKMQDTMINMQADIHRLDKKTDAISNELKETKKELQAEIRQTKAELQEEIAQTKAELQEEIKQTKIELRQEIEQTEIKLTDAFDNKLEKTKKELQLEFRRGLKKNLEETSDCFQKDIFPYLNPNHEKRLANLEKFAKTKGYIMVCEEKNDYNAE